MKSLSLILFWGENQSTLIFAVCSGALISSFAEEIQINQQGRHKGSLKETEEIQLLCNKFVRV